MEEKRISSRATNVKPKSKGKDSQFSIGLVALLVAIGTGIISYLQYRSAEKAIRVTHDDSVRAMQLSNRPYVSVQATTIGKPDHGDIGVRLRFTVTGPSPALQAVVERKCIITSSAGPYREVEPPPDIWKHLNVHPAKADYFPNESVDYHCYARPGNDQDALLFAIGDVSYLDVFGEKHQTTFCFYISPDLRRNEPQALWPCSTGNKML